MTNDHPAQSFGIIDPDYARIFTQARIVAWQYGYACLAHGTFTRDLDLLLVPWADRHVPDAGGVVSRIADVSGLQLQGPPSDKPHWRRAWASRAATWPCACPHPIWHRCRRFVLPLLRSPP